MAWLDLKVKRGIYILLIYSEMRDHMFKIRHLERFRWILPFIIYSVLGIVILWDLLLPGYILTLDMVFTPKIPFPREFYGFDGDPLKILHLPFNCFLWCLNKILPSWLIQKILLFLVFFLSGLGAYSICRAESIWGRLFAGFFYVLNPFVYVRFMVGHLNVLMGYCIFPFLLASFIKLVEDSHVESAVKFVLLSTLILVLDEHFVFIGGLTLLVLLFWKIIDLRKDDMALQRLKEAAEKAKIELSSTASSEINLPYIMPVDGVPKHLVKTLTRATFDKLSDDLLKRLETPMNKAIKESGVKSEDIKEVLLVGGSTRIIAIQELVKKVFNKEPNKSLNPDEVVSIGAAIQGGILLGDMKLCCATYIGNGSALLL